MQNTTVVVMAAEHYFSPDPQSALRTSTLGVSLRGHDVTVQTASGTFSPGGLDRGTAVLLKYAPDPPPTGTLLDVGCGWGAITLALALSSPGATVVGIDPNERARQACSTNIANLGVENARVLDPEDVPEDMTFDLIWSNPPIRVGKAELHAILTRWLNRLTPAGEAWLVVAKKLGGDSLQEWINSGGAGGFLAERAETASGFRLLRVRRP